MTTRQYTGVYRLGMNQGLQRSYPLYTADIFTWGIGSSIIENKVRSQGLGCLKESNSGYHSSAGVIISVLQSE